MSRLKQMLKNFQLWLKDREAQNAWLQTSVESIKTHWAVWQPKLQPYWDRFKAFNDRLFALSDHSSLRGARIMLRVTSVLFGVLFLWSAIFHIDQVVNAQGQVIANSKTQIIQAADGGILTEMRVQEGDEVKAGQVIAVLEKDRALAAYTESFGKVTALRMNVARLQAEIAEKSFAIDETLQKDYPNLVETQMNLYKQRTQGYKDQVQVLKDNVRLAETELKMNAPLEKYGDISKADMLKLQRAVNEAKTNLVNARNKYFQDASAELNKAQEDLNAQEQSLRDRAELLDHTDIVAPVAGIVKNIKVTTLGGVVRQGDEILQILPTEDDLVVEAKVKPADMAAMKVGLPAKVKLDAYDYSIFGSMKGAVTYVSADSLTEDTKNGPLTYYRVKVNILESEFKGKAPGDIEVRPGMTATVDIKTGSRSILSFILKPITKTLSQSFGER
jgi:membrane fusion protein, adhesin transport system